MTFKQHIEKYTQENGLTAKMAERNITIDDICNYITAEARKALDGQDGAIDDATVFGWAVHYIEDAYKEKEQVEKVEAQVSTGSSNNEDDDTEEESVEEEKVEEKPKTQCEKLVDAQKEKSKESEQLCLLDYITETLKENKDEQK